MANSAAMMFMNYLESKQITATYYNEKQSCVRVGVKSGSLKLEMLFFFGDECRDVHVIGREFVQISADKTPQSLVLLNLLNNQYRWYKFVGDVDKDNGNITDITVECDDIIQLDSCAEECFELMQRMVAIVEDVTPKIMKAMWN